MRYQTISIYARHRGYISAADITNAIIRIKNIRVAESDKMHVIRTSTDASRIPMTIMCTPTSYFFMQNSCMKSDSWKMALLEKNSQVDAIALRNSSSTTS